jgi:hypothetical protein
MLREAGLSEEETDELLERGAAWDGLTRVS